MSFDLLKERRAQVVRNNRGGVVALTATRRAQPARSVSGPAPFADRGLCSIPSRTRFIWCTARWLRGLHLGHPGRPVLWPGTSFASAVSTDMREREVVFGGEQRLEASLRRLIAQHAPRAASSTEPASWV